MPSHKPVASTTLNRETFSEIFMETSSKSESSSMMTNSSKEIFNVSSSLTTNDGTSKIWGASFIGLTVTFIVSVILPSEGS